MHASSRKRQHGWSKFGESVLALAVACGIAAVLAKRNVFEPGGGPKEAIAFFLMAVPALVGLVCLPFAGRHWVRWTLGLLVGPGLYLIWWFVFHHQLVHP